jgi:hypothetical protein
MDGRGIGDALTTLMWVSGVSLLLLLGSCSLNVYYFLAY